MKIHPAAELFPMLGEVELKELANDIKAHGLRHPITTYDGQILDGRNRYKACALAQVTPKFEPYSGDSPVAFVVSENIHRRHLDTTAKAKIAVELEPMFKAEAQARMKAGKPRDPSKKINEGRALGQAAKAVGISHVTAHKAKQLKDNAPDVFAHLGEDGMTLAKAHKAHVANNSGNNEWYTPKEFVEAARDVMGGIDCDPASSEIANKTVKATRFYTEEENGLCSDWSGRVWMNPPYAQPLIGDFCDGLLTRLHTGKVTEACVLVNNATETKWGNSLLHQCSAVCFTKKRIKFVAPDGAASGAPLQGQMVVYFGARPAKFAKAFEQLGEVLYASRKR